MTKKEILLDYRSCILVEYRKAVRANATALKRALAKIKAELRRIKLRKV